MHLEQLLAQFVEQIGYPAMPAPNDEGAYHFRFDGLQILVKGQANDRCLFTGVIGSLQGQPPLQREQTLRRLMKVSLVRSTRGVGALSLDRARDEFVLCHSLQWPNMTAADLEEQVDKFLNELEFWVEQLAREAGSQQGFQPPLGLRP